MLTDTTLTKAGISHGRTNHFYYTENEDGTCESSIPEGTGVIDGGASCVSGKQYEIQSIKRFCDKNMSEFREQNRFFIR